MCNPRILDLLMSKKQKLYWLFQVFGWGFVLGFAAIAVYLRGDWEFETGYYLTALFVLGIAVSHLYRYGILKLHWLRHKPVPIIPRIVLGSLIAGLVYYMLRSAFVAFVLDRIDELQALSFLEHVLAIINMGIIFFFWSVIYFASHFIEKSRNQEIQELKMEALKSEMELSSLKSQLNPHFMFNAMNSIRALVDENPNEAKNSITLLSNILRNTLVMGKKEVVSIGDEMSIVRDYLNLEAIRYEERLSVNYRVDESLFSCSIPPLMIQTIVENAIKHGISKLPGGGQLNITIAEDGECVSVKIENTGTLISEKGTSDGIGLKNTRKRLHLLYGDKAGFNIKSNNEMVIVAIVIPKITANASITNR